MSQSYGTNRTDKTRVWKVIPISGKSFWIKQNPFGMAQHVITNATAQKLIADGAVKLDDHQVIKSGREMTINLGTEKVGA